MTDKFVDPKKRYRLYNDDCLGVLKKQKSNVIDTVITDPPYGLKFMGKNWDHGVPGVVFWEEILRVCKPGAVLLAFGGTRTYHRLTCGIEDAGWEIRDCLMWLYGSGFPKSLDVSKVIDKAAGVEREVVGVRHTRTANEKYGGGKGTNLETLETLPATDAAKLWDGWGTSLKPAFEPILLAMKPLDGTFAENAIEHGVAGINVDEGRIKHASEVDRASATPQGKVVRSNFAPGMGIVGTETNRPDTTQGRWPANVIFSHHPACVQRGVKKVKGSKSQEPFGKPIKNSIRMNASKKINRKQHGDADGTETIEAWDCHPECPVRMLDEQSGECPSCNSLSNAKPKSIFRPKQGSYQPQGPIYPNEKGGPSRFFYCAKASKSERNKGLPRGTTSKHPTVKPIKLMEYLCKLTATPTGGIVLDPFMGSGSTGVACAMTGRRFIGCEIDKENNYFEVAKQRIRVSYARNS